MQASLAQYYRNKIGEFRIKPLLLSYDALTIRYGWTLRGTPTHCSCGVPFPVEHELSWLEGGFTILRHNEVRNLMASVLSEVCHNVV